MTDGAIRSLSNAVEAYYEELKTFIARRTGSISAACDIIQETWVRAALAKPDAPVKNEKAYLYRMASRVAVDHLRQEKTWHHRKDDAIDLNALLDPQPGPHDIVSAQQEWLVLTAAIQELPEKCRDVFLLSRAHGLSMRAIADRMAISEKTVEKHIAKALRHCRQRLRDASGGV